jgi:1,4-dihydroxy-2-naphthoate octaprenyltransferase
LRNWLPIFSALACLFAGAKGYLTNETTKSYWILICAPLGWIAAEVGSFLASDYYLYRRNRSNPAAPRTISREMNPPQLVLKGAWGVYLLAFLCALVVAIALYERGWLIIPIAFAGFFLGYYSMADPIYFCRLPAGRMFSAAASSWVPYFSGCYIAYQRPNAWTVGVAAFLFFALCVKSRCR